MFTFNAHLIGPSCHSWEAFVSWCDWYENGVARSTSQIGLSCSSNGGFHWLVLVVHCMVIVKNKGEMTLIGLSCHSLEVFISWCSSPLPHLCSGSTVIPLCLFVVALLSPFVCLLQHCYPHLFVCCDTVIPVCLFLVALISLFVFLFFCGTVIPICFVLVLVALLSPFVLSCFWQHCYPHLFVCCGTVIPVCLFLAALLSLFV